MQQFCSVCRIFYILMTNDYLQFIFCVYVHLSAVKYVTDLKLNNHNQFQDIKVIRLKSSSCFTVSDPSHQICRFSKQPWEDSAGFARGHFSSRADVSWHRLELVFFIKKTKQTSIDSPQEVVCNTVQCHSSGSRMRKWSINPQKT